MASRSSAPLVFPNKHMKHPLNVVAIIGLALGGVFGMAGTFVAEPNLRSIFWGIDGLGLVVATTILALKYVRSGRDAVAAGFLIYAIGESVMFAGTAQPLDAMVPSFGAGTALWAAALLLTSIPPRLCRLDSRGERGRCDSVRYYFRKNPLGRTNLSHRFSAARVRVSFPGPRFHRLDLDPDARTLNERAAFKGRRA
jgi:hypothetical protein